MKVKKLILHDFRGIASMELQFQDSVNVLIGANGAGKSAILDCLAIMLSRLVGRIRSTKKTGRFFSDYDITNGKNETRNRIDVEIDRQNISWMVTRSRKGAKKQRISNFEQLSSVVDKIHSDFESDKELDFPLAVFYPVNRAVLDIPLRIRQRHEFDQLSAYDQALTGARNDFRLFFEWYRNREDLENELRVDDADYRDKELEAVRGAITKLFPGSSDLRIRRKPLRMVVEKLGTEIIVDQLSDGEKCQLALAGDLARRLAVANPSLSNPLKGKGIVLIDEIDLHLHPAWQRNVISVLTRTFPKCQFIVSTHSPQIVSEVKNESIFILTRSNGDVAALHPEGAYGLDANRILEDLMGVADRPRSIKEAIAKLFRQIDDGEYEIARITLEDLNGLIGSDPQLTRAGTLLRRKEIVGK